ncbi:metalloendopeptidase [Elysia marginata]|uniref:Metalloendopeptidase n=1 Tax=Elysia marginata TaxID=1093978 RepID=A0AAV4JUN6_9GAST|nr:metalloendopeptidase [Elysia marginata]
MNNNRIYTRSLLLVTLLVLSPLVLSGVVTRSGYKRENVHHDRSIHLEGDIRYETLLRDGGDRITSRSLSFQWPDGVVHYTIQHSYPQWLKTLIQTAMAQLESQVGMTSAGYRNKRQALPMPCVRFVPGSFQRHFLEIRDDGTCHATLGFSKRTRNVLSVSPFCARLDVLRHQLLHVLGFGHEHQRPDRDQYVQLHRDNMVQPWLFSIKPHRTHHHDLGECGCVPLWRYRFYVFSNLAQLVQFSE